MPLCIGGDCLLASKRYYELTSKKYVYNIMPIENIPSVMRRGIVCYDEMQKIKHTSIALEDVQERRNAVVIPNGKRLHRYANLYFSYNNPMLFRRKEEADHLCILAVSATVLDLDGCVVSDRNAASNLARFYTSDEGLEIINFKVVHDQYWTDNNPIKHREKSAIKCAEILVPNSLSPELIVGAYVVSEEAKQSLLVNGFDKRIHVNPKVFYRKGR